MNKDPWLTHLEEKLSKCFKKTILIYIVEKIDGGSINQTERLRTNHLDLFIKWNSAKRYPDMFNHEFDAIQKFSLLNIKTPQLYIKGIFEERSYLIMEYIPPGIPSETSWNELGEILATLHRNTNESFGYSYNNYIGSLKQSNIAHKKWVQFFIEERIEPQIRQASNLLPQAIKTKFQMLETYMDDFPIEQASLVHGDLWSSNVIFDKNGNPYFIDPAIYFGNREVDIAMTKLFGGFPNEFYESYNSNFPLKSNWQDRIDIWNLYPLLVHLNLFGSSYLPKISSILNKLY